MGLGWGLGELGNKAELGHLGLNVSFEDFLAGVGGIGNRTRLLS